MLPLSVALYLLLAIVGGGGEVEVDKHQQVLWITKEQEGEARQIKEEQEGGRRSSRELFERPTTLQRMLEEASNYVSIAWIQCELDMTKYDTVAFSGSKARGGWEGFCPEGDAGDDDGGDDDDDDDAGEGQDGQKIR